MFEKNCSCNKNDTLALILKLLFAFATIAAAVVAGIKIYEKIREKEMFKLCDCCDEDFFDEDDYCDCGCDCDDHFAETVAEVTEAEINPTEE